MRMIHFMSLQKGDKLECVTDTLKSKPTAKLLIKVGGVYTLRDFEDSNVYLEEIPGKTYSVFRFKKFEGDKNAK